MKILCFLIILLPSIVWSQQSTDLILENANYLNLESGTFESAHIYLRNGLIERISGNEILVENAQSIDASEHFVIPGLIDAHIHLFQSGAIYTRPDVIDLTDYKPYEKERAFLKENAGDLLRRYLALGITSVIDIGGPIYNYSIRDAFKDNTDYPNLFLTGPLVSTYQPPAFDIEDSPIIKVNNEEEARELVKKQLPYEPDFIKIWGIPLRDVGSEELLSIMDATVKESEENNLRVFVHATQLNTAKLAIKAGADVLVHSVADANGAIDDEFIRMLKDSNVVYIPTLIVSRNYSRTLSLDYHPSSLDFNISNPFILGEIFDAEHLPRKHFQRSIDMYSRAKEMLHEMDSTTAINLNLLRDSGIVIATGTDAGNIGTLHASSFHDEVAAMSKAGLNNLEIIRASTINGARALGKEDILGSITEGKIADLVLLKKNPLDNLDHLKSIDLVIKNGKLHKANEIIKVTPEILAQQQLNAYNAGNIDAFLEPYSEDVEIYNFPNDLSTKGKEAMRSNYASFFDSNPDLHCELLNRIVNGNTVIDHERITGIPNRDPFTAIAIYKIENDKITRVTFLR